MKLSFSLITPTAMAAASRSPALALLCANLLLAGAAAASGDVLLMMERFHAWRTVHNRTYATAEERRHRFEVYRGNVGYIEATNRRARALVRARREPVHRPHERGVPGRAHHAARALAAREAVARLLNSTRAGAGLWSPRAAAAATAATPATRSARSPTPTASTGGPVAP